MEVEYQDDDVEVTSRIPLRGTVRLVGDDEEEVTLHLDRDSAEMLMGALAEFLQRIQ